MSRRSAEKNQRKADDNPRRPCPCGSGKRYKACHGLAGGVVDLPVNRPFEGMALECELIAMREFVPSGTAKLPGTDLVLATVLPMAAAALVRADGVKYVGLQVQTRSSDVSRDLARAVLWARDAEPGDVLAVVSPEFDAGDKPERLQDLVDTGAALEVEVHDDFTWWMPEGSEPSGEVALSLERANGAILPTARIGEAAYWVDAGEKAHLRWVRPESEDDLLAALARLHAAGELGLGEGTRYAGSFRAHGLLVPVWDLDREMHAREWAEPAAELGKRLEAALASLGETPLTPAERRSRDGLLNRQKTL
ncbi:DUF5926 family protein [Actinokineospora sp. G85]|uniref:DUF5926 family protein n=1 Tax=Actinokineospora sp. G85 TaxID=3406626 RepID=UPI003C745A06